MTNSIKYTNDDIERIFCERVDVNYIKPTIKAGVIAEWSFTYPNGNIHANVTCAFPVDQANADEKIGQTVCRNNIINELWRICGQYSLITGKKL